MMAAWFLLGASIFVALVSIYVATVGYFMAVDGLAEKRYGSVTLGSAMMALAVVFAITVLTLVYNS